MLRKFLCFLFFLPLLSLTAQNDSISMIFVGDAMMHLTQIEGTAVGNSFDMSHYFKHIEKEVKSADISVVNFETPLGGQPYSGYPVFSAPDEFAQTVRDAGFNLFLLANNHCLDKGTNGLVRTRRVLDSLDIRSVGAYLDKDNRDRSYPLLIRSKGFRIIMLNYTYGTNGFQVTPPRSVNLIDKEVMAADIAEAKLFNPDFIIANMHWGVEYNQIPSDQQRELGNWLFNQGVDVVMGNHPHVVQPIEFKKDLSGGKDRLVVYSMGNLISNMSLRNTNGSMVVKVVFNRKGIKRQIASVKYALLFTERYKNERGKVDHHTVPAVTWQKSLEKNSLPENQVLSRYITDTRELFRKHNMNAEEYIFD